ncbi:MAG: 3-oxoacyl-ACP synthase III [Planctomycetaceae bacterium]
MRFQNVCIEAFGYTLPDEVVTSDEIESRLAPLYERLALPAGRLELMTGIRERRFFAPGTQPGQISVESVRRAIDASGIPAESLGALVHGSVCRDQLEPATAATVHYGVGLPHSCAMFDVSNACLGILNGMILIANMIELGQIHAGVVVGTETGRGLVEGTIDSLLRSREITRKDVKGEFASLTIGSASAAIVLCNAKISRTGNHLLGACCRADSSYHELCAGGVESEKFGDDRPRMQTDSEALLHAGVGLAAETWGETQQILNWNNASVHKSFTHQVGRAHRSLLYNTLGLSEEIDFSTVDFLGNTGSAALPVTAAIGLERGHVKPHENVALLGIGSGLNSIMAGFRFEQLLQA